METLKMIGGKIFLAIFLLVLAGQCLYGCAVVLPVGVGSGDGWSIGENTSYFSNYAAKADDRTCKVKGHVNLHITEAGVMRLTAGKNSEITVKGKMEDAEGDIRLVYMSSDGTETVISDGGNRKIDEKVAVTEGEGEIYFAGEGGCDFSLEMKAGESVIFGSREEGETTSDCPEITEDLTGDMIPDEELDFSGDMILDEELGSSGDMILDEELGFPGVTDNWPESIVLEDSGMTAQPLYVAFKVEEAMKISVSCTTMGGSLRLKIVNEDAQRVYFDEEDPRGSYEVTIDEPGSCCLIVYAREHEGTVSMVPVE